MPLHRVRFERRKTSAVFDTNSPIPRFHDETEGIVIGAVAKLAPKTYYGTEGLIPAQPENVTYLIIGCDDGKIEERALNSVRYLLPETI